MNDSRGQGRTPSWHGRQRRQQTLQIEGAKADENTSNESPTVQDTRTQQESTLQSVAPNQKATEETASNPGSTRSNPSPCKPPFLNIWKCLAPWKASSPRRTLQALPNELILLILEEAAYSSPGTLHATINVSRHMRCLSLCVIRNKLFDRLHSLRPAETYLGFIPEEPADDNGSDTDSDGGIAPPLLFITRLAIPFRFSPFESSEMVNCTAKFRIHWGYDDVVTSEVPGSWMKVRIGADLLNVPRHLGATQPEDVPAWYEPGKRDLYLDWRPFMLKALSVLWRQERREEMGMWRKIWVRWCGLF